MSLIQPLDAFDPTRAARGLAALDVRDTALFESTLPGGERGRWSMIAFAAERRLLFDEASGWSFTGSSPTPALARFEKALAAAGARPWEGLIAAEHGLADEAGADAVPAAPESPPFRGGFSVGLSYDAARRLDGFTPWAARAAADRPWPWFDLRLFGAVCAIDLRDHRAWLVAVEHPLFARPAAERIAAMRSLLARALAAEPPQDPAEPPGAGPEPPLLSNMDDARYAAAFERLTAYLRAGDLYQANLTRRFEAPCGLDAPALYARLRRSAPAPYAGLLDDRARAVISASPELFLARRGDRLVTRPIKGTRPRGADPARDARLVAELLASPKDHAEHVMIVDVHRNDLGRVCAFGTVEVTHLAKHEAFPTVHHLTSTIAGTMRAGHGPGSWEAIAAAFPAGSISGAPKRRACEVIEELEPTRRALYCGSIGWWDVGGDFALNVAIRTILLAGGTATFQAGGGIVIDSRVELEAAETWSKARALNDAIGRTAPARVETP